MSSRIYFDKVADQWDKMRTDFFSEAVREKAFEIAVIHPGKLAADIGAGTGFMTEGLVQKGLEVIAVDQSGKMLDELEEKFSGSGRIDCRMGNAENLPIEDKAADYVFANMYLHHVENPAGAIREMTRILKAGGKLVISDIDEHEFEFLKIEHHDRWMGFKREDVAEWFKEAGLNLARVDCAGQDCCAESCSSDASAKISIFIASGEK